MTLFFPYDPDFFIFPGLNRAGLLALLLVFVVARLRLILGVLAGVLHDYLGVVGRPEGSSCLGPPAQQMVYDKRVVAFRFS